MLAPTPALEPLDLPVAPPITRPTARGVRRRRGPAVVLLVLGLVLAVGPIVGGLFSDIASGELLLDEFEPHLDPAALSRYDADLAALRTGIAGAGQVLAAAAVPPGRFPGVEEHLAQADAIDARATDLLARVRAAEPDYREVAAVGGLERVPFLLVLAGLVAAYGGALLLGGTPRRARTGGALVLLVAAALAAYPLLGPVAPGTRAAHRLVEALEPVMTPQEVRQLQDDFVVLVQSIGELDTGVRQVPQSGPPAAAVAALLEAWPRVSSDLAELVGTINDNIDDYEALRGLDDLGSPVGTSGLAALPWTLVATATATAALALLAWPRRAPLEDTP